MLEYDGAGNVVHRYLHGAGIDQLFADEDALNEILWSLSDRQGTIRDWAEYDELADTTTVANHVVFDGFGKITSQTDPNHEVTIRSGEATWESFGEPIAVRDYRRLHLGSRRES